MLLGLQALRLGSHLGFRVLGLLGRVVGLFGVKGFRVQGFRVLGLSVFEFMAQGLKLWEFEFNASRFRVSG